MKRILFSLLLILFCTKLFSQIQPYYIGDLDKKFWNTFTMVDRWTKQGAGLNTVPNFLTNTNIDFHYKKRPFTKEIMFADRVNIVRPLGGWNPNWSNGELNDFPNVQGADVVYRNASGQLQFRLNLLKGRIDPYINMGYGDSITLVFDNFPYALTSNPVNSTYGQSSIPDNVSEWEFVIENVMNALYSWYGNSIYNWKFRLGTEWSTGPRFQGVTSDYIALYQATHDGIINALGNEVNLSVYNIAGAKSNPAGAPVNILNVIQYIKNNNLPFAFSSVSDYSIPQSNLNNTSAATTINRLNNFWNSVDAILPAPREIHEYGILQNEFGLSTNEPGARGACRSFDIFMSLWEDGLREVMHWTAGDHFGSSYLMNGESWLFSLLEHQVGAKVYNYPIPHSGDLEPKVVLFEHNDKVYLIASAFHKNRNSTNSMSVQLAVPGAIDLNPTYTVRSTSISENACLYKSLYNDLKANGNLKGSYNVGNGLLAPLNTMSNNFNTAKNMVNASYASYSQEMANYLTLTNDPSNIYDAATNRFNLTLSPSKITIYELEKEDAALTFDIKVLLEGAYNQTSGTMDNALHQLELLPGMLFTNPGSGVETPAGQPYDIAPWNYTGNEGDTYSNSDYDPTSIDWVLLSLRTGINPNTEIHQTAGILKADGTVEFLPGTGYTGNAQGPFYVLIEHRNHVGVLSPQPLFPQNRVLTYDFTTQDSWVPANGGFGQKQLPGGSWGMYAADGDQISDIISYDINGADRIFWGIDNGIFRQYLASDYDLNGEVTGADRILWNVNSGINSSVPK